MRDVQQRTGTYKDYAIVARFVDPNTDQYALVVAGIARGGTVAAGEFLVDSSRTNEMLNYIPKGWDRKNGKFENSHEKHREFSLIGRAVSLDVAPRGG